jgi:hypothetical protein
VAEELGAAADDECSGNNSSELKSCIRAAKSVNVFLVFL